MASLFVMLKVARRAEKLAREHTDEIERGIRKVAKTVDERTGGKHSEKIGQAEAKAGALVARLGPKQPANAAPEPPPPEQPLQPS